MVPGLASTEDAEKELLKLLQILNAMPQGTPSDAKKLSAKFAESLGPWGPWGYGRLPHGGFHSWRYPHSWMVSVRENPIKRCDDWGYSTPILGNHHMPFFWLVFIGFYWFLLVFGDGTGGVTHPGEEIDVAEILFWGLSEKFVASKRQLMGLQTIHPPVPRLAKARGAWRWSQKSMDSLWTLFHLVPSCSRREHIITGWWFGCHFLFSHILEIIIPID